MPSPRPTSRSAPKPRASIPLTGPKPASKARLDKAQRTFRDAVTESGRTKKEDRDARHTDTLIARAKEVFAAADIAVEQHEVKGRPVLRVLPDPKGAYLARLAVHLEASGIHLRYEPSYLLSRNAAGAFREGDAMLMPHATIETLTRDANGTLLHELHHWAQWRAVQRGVPRLLHASASARGDRVIDEHHYKTYLSFEEISTYTLQAAQAANRVRRVRRHMAEGKLDAKQGHDALAGAQKQLAQKAGRGSELALATATVAEEALALLRADEAELKFHGPSKTNSAVKVDIVLEDGWVRLKLPSSNLANDVEAAKVWKSASAQAQLARAAEDELERIVQLARQSYEALGLAHEAAAPEPGSGLDEDLEWAIELARGARRNIVAEARRFASDV